MTHFLLVTAHECHLCEHGRRVLTELASEGLLTWREVEASSDEGQVLVEAAPPLRPLLLDLAGHLVACGRLSSRSLRRHLAAA